MYSENKDKEIVEGRREERRKELYQDKKKDKKNYANCVSEIKHK